MRKSPNIKRNFVNSAEQLILAMCCQSCLHWVPCEEASTPRQTSVEVLWEPRPKEKPAADICRLLLGQGQEMLVSIVWGITAGLTGRHG